jgi:type II secretory pathway component GspD/PulD (secretin)
MAASVSRPKTEAYETVESKPPTKPEDTVIPSINAKAPLSEVLEMIRKKTTININLLGDGTKPIQITDKDVKLGVLIANICAIAGYSHLKVGNAIEIGPDDTLKNAFPEEYAAAHATPAVPEVVEPQDNETKVYHTNYLDAKKLVDAISKNYTPKGLLMYMSPETPSPTLDSGISASASTGAQSSSTLGTDDISKMSRIIILTGPTKAVEGAIDLFKALDVQPAQVSIQVEVHDISENGAKQLGATWTLPTETFTENTPSGIALSDYARSPLSFSAQLNALETKGEDKLLARPNISVDDGQRGYVLVGDRLQYPILTGYSQTGSAIFSTQQENVGIYLQVSAWITNDGKVKLKLYPQVSTVTGFTSIAGSQYPNISTRESQSTVTIDSGKTFVIAGLIQDEDIKNVQGIPILDQLPFFKELFTFRSKTHTRNEVLITITPTITNHS